MSAADSNLDPLLERCAVECLERGWRLAWLMLRHREDAADAVQSAFVVALRKRGSIPAENPWPWLAAVIAREAMHIRRKRARAASLDAGDATMPEDTALGPLAELERREREVKLARALDELPAPERDALLLTQLGGLTYAQAAQALGVPLGTFNHQVSRALAELRRKLREDEPAVARGLAVLPILAPPPGLRESLVAHAAGAGAVATVAFGGLAVKKTTALIGALILVLLLGVGTVAVVTWPEPEEPGRTSISRTDTAHESAETIDKPTRSPAVSKAEPVTPVVSPPANEVPPDTPKNEDPAPAPEQPARRVLVVTDTLGNPVSTDFLVDWRLTTDDTWFTQRVKTGADGRAQLDAQVDATLRVNLVEPGRDWILASTAPTFMAGTIEARLKVYAFVSARVRVTYADGKPYVGMLSVSAKGLWETGLQMGEGAAGGKALPPGWPNRDDREGYEWFNEVVEFAGLPIGVDITFRTIAVREGYGEVSRVVSAAEIGAGKLIEVVIPQGVSPNTPAKVVLIPPEDVTLEGTAKLIPLEVTNMRIERSWSVRLPVRDKPGEYEPRLEATGVRAGRYVLHIIGKTPWYSGEIDIQPGETKELHPQPEKPASVRARVVDTDGNPLARAVLATTARAVPHLISMRDSAPSMDAWPGEAATNDQGAVAVGNFPAGTFKFQVYAVGFQPWEGFATLTAGDEHDLGLVRLEKAQGRVVVKLPDWDFTKRKVKWYLQDKIQREVYARGTVTSSEFAIEGLPIGRTYRLTTHIPVGGGYSRAFWFTKPFELTIQQPAKELDGTDQKWPDDLD